MVALPGLASGPVERRCVVEEMKDQEPGSQLGELQLGVASRGDLRWAVADVTAPLEAMRRRLDLSPIAAVALGRALAAAALVLRFASKEPSRLVLEVLADGPLGKVVAEVDSHGRLRGLVGEPRLATPSGGAMAIGWAVGNGTLRITQESERGRYSSQTELVSGEIGKDLVHFLEQSRQIHSAALLGVLPRPAGIGAAGGLLIEAFPGAPEETLEQLEANITVIGSVGGTLAAGGLGTLRDRVLDGFDREDLERYPLVYECRCRREALVAQIQHLSNEDLEAIIDEHGRFEAVCAFCGNRYKIDREELRVS